jgi:hypothetical protein
MPIFGAIAGAVRPSLRRAAIGLFLSIVFTHHFNKLSNTTHPIVVTIAALHRRKARAAFRALQLPPNSKRVANTKCNSCVMQLYLDFPKESSTLRCKLT